MCRSGKRLGAIWKDGRGFCSTGWRRPRLPREGKALPAISRLRRRLAIILHSFVHSCSSNRAPSCWTKKHEPLLRTPMDCIKAAHRILASAFTSSAATFFSLHHAHTLTTRQSAPECRWERSAPSRQIKEQSTCKVDTVPANVHNAGFLLGSASGEWTWASKWQKGAALLRRLLCNSRAPETASTPAMESRAVWLGHGSLPWVDQCRRPLDVHFRSLPR